MRVTLGADAVPVLETSPPIGRCGSGRIGSWRVVIAGRASSAANWPNDSVVIGAGSGARTCADDDDDPCSIDTALPWARGTASPDVCREGSRAAGRAARNSVASLSSSLSTSLLGGSGDFVVPAAGCTVLRSRGDGVGRTGCRAGRGDARKSRAVASPSSESSLRRVAIRSFTLTSDRRAPCHHVGPRCMIARTVCLRTVPSCRRPSG